MAASPFVLTSSEGLPIRGDVHGPSAPGAPVVVCVHGFKGFKDWGFWPETAQRLEEAGYAAVRFNFTHSGIGEQPESITETGLFESGTYSREVADLREVIEAVRAGRLSPSASPGKPESVGLLAHSRGSISALQAAAAGDLGVRSVVLWNPVAVPLGWGEEERRRWREVGYWIVVHSRTGQVFRVGTALLEDAEKNAETLDPLRAAGRLGVPLLVVVSADDESVSPEAGRRIARAVPLPLGALSEIDETGHTFDVMHPFQGATPPLEAAIQVTVEHFDRTLKGTG